MLIEYKNGSVQLVGTVFRDAEVKQAGRMEIAQATVAESQDKDASGNYQTNFERITGKFATLKMVRGLHKDDIVKVYGHRTSRTYNDREGVAKTVTEIEAQWVEVWGQHGMSDAQLPDGFMPAAHDMADAPDGDGDMPF